MKKYEITQTFPIKKSRYLITQIIFSHTLAILAVFLAAIQWEYQLIIACALLVSMFFSVKKEYKKAVFFIRQHPIKGWEIAIAEGQFDAIEILPSTRVFNFLIALQFITHDQQKKALLIVKDALITDDFRQLQVALKINGLNVEENKG